MFNEQNRHGATHIVLGDGVHSSTAIIIQFDIDLGLPGLRIVGLFGVLNIITGHDIAPHDVLVAAVVRVGLYLRATRVRQRLKAKFQISKLVEDLFRASAVLNAWQVHYDARPAQTLHLGFRDTEFVHTVTQTGQVLTDGSILKCTNFFIGRDEP